MGGSHHNAYRPRDEDISSVAACQQRSCPVASGARRLTPEFASDEIGPSAQDGQAPRCWTSSPFPLSRSLGLILVTDAGDCAKLTMTSCEADVVSALTSKRSRLY